MKYKTNSLPSILDEFFNEDWLDFLPAKEFKNFSPLGDVIENDEAFELELMLPGVGKENIKLKVDDDVLAITAERKKVEDNKYNRIESYFGNFKKTYTLPKDVDRENIKASYENGVLKVTIPKDKEAVVSKLIEIE